ncbi:MAG TPA: 2OG-Fe(II) oxygenase [Steroidobacteraceae bacterium]|nr:2OG-Fe(II) oxygenase [Steroidobacteraceae bacterium]
MIDDRVAALDWSALQGELDEYGVARAAAVLRGQECREIAGLYELEEGFRSRVIMGRHGFGRGEYRYFSYPLPVIIQSLRASLYSRLADIANRWHALMGLDARFPNTHAAFLKRCHAAGQSQPTPLLLQYLPDDFNCLHQDIYGEHVFPLQAAILLSEPGRDFEGGEFVVTEQRPRMQSRVEVMQLNQGDLVIFAVRDRPAKGARGNYRVKHRHGVSRLRGGLRHMLGIIFHDALK